MIAKRIMETARALQMDPLDLATIISYETAGTFDPTKRGPTTQWGQHRGLIQFGEPQARQYGVNWDDPVGSQLGADGAVAKYFLDNGWQPGMGMMDAYSIVNAGGPGRYNRSDANNGGAPGTVADKVNGQMAGHRRNAERLLAGVDAQTAPNTHQTAAGPLHTGADAPPEYNALSGLHTGARDGRYDGAVNALAAIPEPIQQMMAYNALANMFQPRERPEHYQLTGY